MENQPTFASTPSSLEPRLPSEKTTAPLITKVFLGPYGLRPGWRLLLYVAICFGVASIVGLIARLFGGRPGARNLAQITPWQLGVFEAALLFYSVVAAWIMSKIEGREFGQYGLPWKQALRRDFWIGLLWGFLTTSGSLLAIFLLGGVRITGLAIHGATIAASAAAWTVTFLIVGLAEEFSFRGYPQFTLTTGMGFWPSAFVLSGLFGLLHAGNSGENILGELSVVLFGMLFCLFLRRTGNLWFAVGFHMGYDWGQTFFYGVPDSGLLPYHNLLTSVFSGPRWLTGGSVGPEASIFTPIALLTVGILFSLRRREARYRPSPGVSAKRAAPATPLP